MENDDFILIQGWMINDLGLSGNKLLVYAIIYSFSHKTKEHYFKGGAKYLIEATKAGRRTVFDSLKSLCEAGLIIKEEGEFEGISYVWYTTTALPVRKLPTPSAETAPKKYIKDNKESIPSLSHSEDKSSSFDNSVIEERRQKGEISDSIFEEFKEILANSKNYEAICGWIESRKKTNKKPPTDKAIELAVRRAVKFSEETPQHSVADYFDNSTLNGWQGIFQFKEESSPSQSGYRKNIKAAPDYVPGVTFEEEVLE